MIIEAWLIMTLGSALAVAGVIAVVTNIITRYWSDIISWFQKQPQIKNADENSVIFTLREKMVSGDCAFVQGVFNKQSDKLENVRRIKSQQVDDELREIHAVKTLAIYQ